jgi:hypothetical protein
MTTSQAAYYSALTSYRYRLSEMVPSRTWMFRTYPAWNPYDPYRPR